MAVILKARREHKHAKSGPEWRESVILFQKSENQWNDFARRARIVPAGDNPRHGNQMA
ncbi:hypothetical protein [Cupriavidus pauculus]|uniref:hypothetical protein n=1 Tax=Cupriavidus pauculus TaxID=82633 RepID=UPI0038579321